jgi:hypothetical protein
MGLPSVAATAARFLKLMPMPGPWLKAKIDCVPALELALAKARSISSVDDKWREKGGKIEGLFLEENMVLYI